MAYCPQCGAPIPAGSNECKYCGEKFQQQPQQTYQQQQPQPQQTYQQQQPQAQQTYQQPQPQAQQPYQPQPQQTYQQPYQQPQANPYQQPLVQNVYVQQPFNGINPAWPLKSKTAAGLLGIFLGGIGVHKFYLGKVGMGILYLLFCWTGVPAIIGFIEGIIYLTSNDHNFQISNQVRLQ